MNGIAAYAKAIIQIYGNGKYGYVYGAQGQIITKAELQKLKDTYGKWAPGGPGYYDTPRVTKWIGGPAADCSGLVCMILSKLNITKTDMTAHDLMKHSIARTRAELEPGDLAFVIKGTTAQHVGIYIGNGLFVQARGTDYGVVETDEKKYHSWNAYGTFEKESPVIHWAEPYFEFLKDQGINYSDKNYDNYMTRGEYFAASAKEIARQKE